MHFFFIIGTNSRFFDYQALMTSFSYSSLTLRPAKVTTHCRSLIEQIQTNTADSIGTSDVILSDTSDHISIFTRIKLDEALTSDKYVIYNVRLNNDVFHEKFSKFNTAAFSSRSYGKSYRTESIRQLYAIYTTGQNHRTSFKNYFLSVLCRKVYRKLIHNVKNIQEDSNREYTQFSSF